MAIRFNIYTTDIQDVPKFIVHTLGGDRIQVGKHKSPYNLWIKRKPKSDRGRFPATAIKRLFTMLSSFILWIIDEINAYSNKGKAEMHYLYGAAERQCKGCPKFIPKAFSNKSLAFYSTAISAVKCYILFALET